MKEAQANGSNVLTEHDWLGTHGFAATARCKRWAGPLRGGSV
jgi:hypothetical protein